MSRWAEPTTRTAISRVAVWRPAVHTIDDTQAAVALEPVKQHDRTVAVRIHLQVSFDLATRARTFATQSRSMSIGRGWRPNGPCSPP
jgi:hypothetical protein